LHLVLLGLDPAAQTHQESDDSADQEHNEQNLRDAGGTDCDSTETKEGGDQRNDKKYHGIVKHFRT
jgi:hypothetical protein